MLSPFSSNASAIAELKSTASELKDNLSPAHKAAGGRITRDLRRAELLIEQGRNEEARRLVSKHLLARACGVVAA